MACRLGDILVRNGAITEGQKLAILEAQVDRRRPFGVLAEAMFDVNPSAVEDAWAEQYAEFAETIDPEAIDPEATALELLERRQAWQFRVLPLTEIASELVAVTAQPYLPRALRFVGWRVAKPVRFVLTDEDTLGSAIARCYPMADLAGDSLMAA